MASTSGKKTEEEMRNEPPAEKMEETIQEPEWKQIHNKDTIVVDSYQTQIDRIMKKQQKKPSVMEDPNYQFILSTVYGFNLRKGKKIIELLTMQENFLDCGFFDKEDFLEKANEEEEIVEEEINPKIRELKKKVEDVYDKVTTKYGELRRKRAAVEELEKTPGVGVPGVSYKKYKSTQERVEKMWELKLEFIQQYFGAQEAEDAKIDAQLELLTNINKNRLQIEKLNKETEMERLKLLE